MAEPPVGENPGTDLVTEEDVELTPTMVEKAPEEADACLNCGTTLKGPYCHHCGQPDRRFIRFFPALIRDVVTDILDYDARFLSTLRPLLFSPGRLTRDYLGGKRARFSPPWRLYLVASLIFFLLAALQAQLNIEYGIDGSDSQVIAPIDQTAETADDPDTEPEAATSGPPVSEPAMTGPPREAANESGKTDNERIFNINIAGDDWDAEDNPLVIPFAPQVLNDWINRELAKSDEKSAQIEQDPGIIVDQIFDLLPGTMFLLLPVFALILKLFYPFSRRYYVEHLIFSLHNHSFLLIIGIIMLMYAGIAEFTQFGLMAAAGDLVSLVLVIWIPLYFWIAMKRVYQQGWFVTSIKYVLVGTVYFSVLTAVAVLAGILAFLLL